MEDLIKVCYLFLEDTLNIEHTLFWRLSGKYGQTGPARKRQTPDITDFKQLNSVSSLKNVSEEMMKKILSDDRLEVKSEVEVCEMLMKWLHLQTEAKEEVHSHLLLPLLRWSGVSIDYVNSKLLQNTILTSDSTSVHFLSKVMTYLLSGVQFEGLQTLHRPSTGLENCLMIFGLGDGFKNSPDVYSVSLCQQDRVVTLTTKPVDIKTVTSVCWFDDHVYLTGIRKQPYTQTWTWNASFGWRRCADTLTDRWYHCSTVVDSMLYVLGGLGGTDNTTLSSVERYDTKTNKWSSAGRLLHAVKHAACVTYKNSIYVFGGIDEYNNDAAHVQVYNPAAESCSLDTPMPLGYSHMRAMLWDTSVILLCYYTCFIYDFETGAYHEREQFGTDTDYFSSTLDNSTVFIAGGGTLDIEEDNKVVWTCTDEIRSVSVLDIVQDKPAVWKHHAKLTTPAMIHSYVNISLPSLIYNHKIQ